jgi:hypothetical protein
MTSMHLKRLDVGIRGQVDEDQTLLRDVNMDWEQTIGLFLKLLHDIERGSLRYSPQIRPLP